jgi:hypothetical protein
MPVRSAWQSTEPHLKTPQRSNFDIGMPCGLRDLANQMIFDGINACTHQACVKRQIISWLEMSLSWLM